MSEICNACKLKYLGNDTIESTYEEIPDLFKYYILESHKELNLNLSGDYFVVYRASTKLGWGYYYNILCGVGSSEKSPTWLNPFPFPDRVFTGNVEVHCVKDLDCIMLDMIKDW